MNTLTTREAANLLGIKLSQDLRKLARTYPRAFVVDHQGTGKGNPTRYQAEPLLQFAADKKIMRKWK
jgi:hypothetical protein